MTIHTVNSMQQRPEGPSDKISKRIKALQRRGAISELGLCLSSCGAERGQAYPPSTWGMAKRTVTLEQEGKALIEQPGLVYKGRTDKQEACNA